MRTLLLAIAILMIAAPAAAQQSPGFTWTLNDGKAPPDPARAAQGEFGAMLATTSDYEGFLQAWAGPTPPNLVVTDEITREKPVHAMLLFSGCRAGPDGNCNVTARFSTTAPGGSPYGEAVESAGWRRPPGPRYAVQLAESGLGFQLDPGDPLGIYTLKAEVTDHVAGITLIVEKAVTAKADR